MTGAAGSGKSTVCAALAGLPGFVLMDGDVIASGAAAVQGAGRDDEAFWHYALAIAGEVAANDLVPVFGCVCLPDQVLASSNTYLFTRVGFLALTQQPGSVARRLSARQGDSSALSNIDLHEHVNDQWRRATVPDPHTVTKLDTSHVPLGQTLREAREWLLSNRC